VANNLLLNEGKKNNLLVFASLETVFAHSYGGIQYIAESPKSTTLHLQVLKQYVHTSMMVFRTKADQRDV
jgi:hypothetical protein